MTNKAAVRKWAEPSDWLVWKKVFIDCCLCGVIMVALRIGSYPSTMTWVRAAEANWLAAKSTDQQCAELLRTVFRDRGGAVELCWTVEASCQSMSAAAALH